MRRGVVSESLPSPSVIDLPNIDAPLFRVPDPAQLRATSPSTHAPRIALLYGSLRARSFSRLLAEEAARLLQAMGAETRIFNPSGLPLPDDAPDTHPKVVELRALAQCGCPVFGGKAFDELRDRDHRVPQSGAGLLQRRGIRRLQRCRNGLNHRIQRVEHFLQSHRVSLCSKVLRRAA